MSRYVHQRGHAPPATSSTLCTLQNLSFATEPYDAPSSKNISGNGDDWIDPSESPRIYFLVVSALPPRRHDSDLPVVEKPQLGDDQLRWLKAFRGRQIKFSSCDRPRALVFCYCIATNRNQEVDKWYQHDSSVEDAERVFETASDIQPPESIFVQTIGALDASEEQVGLAIPCRDRTIDLIEGKVNTPLTHAIAIDMSLSTAYHRRPLSHQLGSTR